MTPYRALTQVHLGALPPVPAGQVIPEKFKDMNGDEHPVDFERLEDLGAAEKISAARAKAIAAGTDDGDDGEGED